GGGIGPRIPARRHRGSRQCSDCQLYQRGRPRPRTVDRPAQDGDGNARRRFRCDHAKHRQGLQQPQIHLPRLLDLNQHRRCNVRCGQGSSGQDLHLKTAIIMSEDAAWTTPLDAEYLKCLPQIGLKVLDHIRVSPDTTDFTPIYNKIEGEKPDVMITGISHVGVQPTVQWKQQEVPIPMFGIYSQATNSSFSQDSNGAVEGVLYGAFSRPGVAVTSKTLPFVAAFNKRYGNNPSYCGYTAYDEVYYIAEAIKRAGSTEPDKLVDAL